MLGLKKNKVAPAPPQNTPTRDDESIAVSHPVLRPPRPRQYLIPVDESSAGIPVDDDSSVSSESRNLKSYGSNLDYLLNVEVSIEDKRRNARYAAQMQRNADASKNDKPLLGQLKFVEERPLSAISGESSESETEEVAKVRQPARKFM